MNLLLGIIIILGFFFFLGRFMGFFGENFMVILMIVFALIIFAVSVGYAFF